MSLATEPEKMMKAKEDRQDTFVRFRINSDLKRRMKEAAAAEDRSLSKWLIRLGTEACEAFQQPVAHSTRRHTTRPGEPLGGGKGKKKLLRKTTVVEEWAEASPDALPKEWEEP